MRHSSTCVDNTIIYLRIQYLRRCALGTPWIFVILAIWTSTWIIFLSHTSPNKRGFQSYNKRRFSFKGSYLGFIALKSIQIRFATVLPILMESRVSDRGSGRVRAQLLATSGHKMEAEVRTYGVMRRSPARLSDWSSCCRSFHFHATNICKV